MAHIVSKTCSSYKWSPSLRRGGDQFYILMELGLVVLITQDMVIHNTLSIGRFELVHLMSDAHQEIKISQLTPKQDFYVVRAPIISGSPLGWDVVDLAGQPIELRLTAKELCSIDDYIRTSGALGAVGNPDWVQTFSGEMFFPTVPERNEVLVEDIAHSLSQQCRYNGHTKKFYSVAEHCLLLSSAVPKRYALEALLHDAAEAYIGDMVRPIKNDPLFKPFKEVEDLILGKIMGTLVPQRDFSGLSKVVIAADNAVLCDEQLQCFDKFLDWEMPFQPLGVTIQFLCPEEAEEKYLLRFTELTKENTKG